MLDSEQVGQLGAEISDLADLVTGDDRSAYEVWFHQNQIWIGLRHEDDRDEFAEICDDEAAADEDLFDNPALLMTSRMQANENGALIGQHPPGQTEPSGTPRLPTSPC